MADAETLRRLVRLRREDRFLEYKESGAWNDLKDKIAKTALGMANIRDGGTIVLGVSERSGQFEPEGVSTEHLATYHSDEVQDYIHRFADPYVRTELQPFEDGNRSFLAIVVHRTASRVGLLPEVAAETSDAASFEKQREGL